MTINNLTDRTDLTDLDGDGGDFVGVDKTPILNKTVLSLNSVFTKFYYSKLDKVDKDKNFLVSYERVYDNDGEINTTKCFYSYNNFDEFNEIQKKESKENRRWHEIIKENSPLVECYDLDAKYNDKNERNLNMFNLYNEIGEDAMIEQFKHYRKEFIERNYPQYDLSNEIYAISSCSNNKKFSIHIAIRNERYFQNSDKIKIFMRNFDKFLSHDNKFILDLNIYNKNHAMRILENTKYGQNRFLKKHRSCSNLDDKLFLFSYIQPDDKVFTIYDDIKPDLKIIEKTLSFDKSTDYNNMTILLPHIKDNITYSNWSLIGQVIYNISDGSNDGLEQFIEWSKKDYDDFDEDSVIKKWSTYKITTHNLGVLVNQVKKDNPEVLKDFFKKSQSPEFVFIEDQEEEEIDDKYCWTDFDNDRREIFNSYDELMTWFKKMFPLVCNKINIGKGCYLKNEYSELKYNPVSCYELNKNTLFYYYSITKKGDKTISTKNSIALGFLFEDSKLKTYSRITCKPNNNINKYEFNVWEKFKADVKIEYDINKLKPLFDYILEIICDNQEILFKYIISWLRHICKKPQIKTGKVLVFQSDKQRAGKGTFINWLMFHVFGKNSSYATSLSKLTQKFNSFLINKSLIIVDELPTTSTKFHNTFDILKSLITEPCLDIEYKGKESIQTDNLCNFVFSTNNEKSIKIEKDDGRYVIFKINESKVGDIEFWNHVHTNVFTEDMGIHFFNYLINIDDNDDILVSIHQIPETELKNRMKEMSLNSMEIFIKLLKERNIDDFKLNDLLNDNIVKEKDNYDNEFILLNKIDINIKLKFKKQSLYNHYISWCNKSGETQMKQKYFNTILTELRKSDYRYYEI